MPTRKQRRRALKERRHDYEYETVWVDPVTGEEVEPPEDYVEEPPEKPANGTPKAKSDGAKPKSRAKAPQQRGSRPVRVPPAPSWQRATKRALIFGVVIFAVFAILGSKNGHHNYAAALLLGGVYTLIFIPFTYYIDRFSHNRWQRRAEQQGQKGAARKR